MGRDEDSEEMVKGLINKLLIAGETGKKAAELIEKVRNRNRRYLPVLIQNPSGDLQNAFIYALYEALKREGINKIIPDTAYSLAVNRINDWKKHFPSAYDSFSELLKEKGKTVELMKRELKSFSKTSLQDFIEIYPKITSGSKFNPLVSSDVFSTF